MHARVRTGFHRRRSPLEPSRSPAWSRSPDAVAGLAEATLIRVLQPSELELDWISDVVLSSALGIAVYLWLHLRATRLALTERERTQVIIQSQLSMAEAMQRRLLPSIPQPFDGLEWAALLTPAGRIGGDPSTSSIPRPAFASR